MSETSFPGDDHLSLEEWRVIEAAKTVVAALDRRSRVTLESAHSMLRANVAGLLEKDEGADA